MSTTGISSAAIPSIISEIVLPMTNIAVESSRPTWTLTPVVHIRHDMFSRFVEFEGRPEPYIEPHFSVKTDGSATDADFLGLVAARWSEYRAERYLQNSGDFMASASEDETRANTPVQLFLAHKRLTRARLEIEVYTKLLKTARPALLQDFEATATPSILVS